jgi:hypothetical protein
VPPAAVCFPGLIPSVRFRSNGSDRGYRFAHARLTPCPTCQRHPQPLIFPGLIFPRPILIERLGPPPSDLDRTVRTSSDPYSRPFPLWRWARSVNALSPAVVDTPCPACQCSPAPSAIDLISTVGFRSDD